MNLIQRAFPALGTMVELTLDSESLSEDALLDLSIEAQSAIAEVQDSMSFHESGSELTLLNQEAHLRPVVVSEGLAEVLHFALRLAKESDGLFDPTVAPVLESLQLLPELSNKAESTGSWQDVVIKGREVRFECPLHLDLGGIAKGWAVDQALQAIKGQDVEAVVNAGGDLRMSHWKGKRALIRESGRWIEMAAPALATSSSQNFEEGNDLVEPRSSRIQLSPEPVSVFAPSCMAADALTKVASLHPQAAEILSRFDASLVE